MSDTTKFFVGRARVPAAAVARGGGLALADDLFLVGLNDRTGGHVVDGGLLALGLAGGLLAELIIAGAAAIDASQTVAVLGGAEDLAPDDATRVIVNLIARERPLSATTWVEFLARDAVDAVARRLKAQNLIGIRRRRSLLGSAGVRYPAIDRNTVAYRPVRLARLLAAPGVDVDTTADKALLMIAHSIDLTRHITRDLRDRQASARARLNYLHFTAETTDPSLHRLAVALGQLAAARAISRRR